MRIHTQDGWVEGDWEVGYPLPDHHSASMMWLEANDLIPNMNEDDVKDVIHLIEYPVNEALSDNEDADENDKWRLCGLMFQKTTLVDDDEENTSLAGTSSELNVANADSPGDYEMPFVLRRMIPMDRIKEIMDVTGITGDQRLPDEVMNFCDQMDIGIASQVVVDEETCTIFNLLESEMEKKMEDSDEDE
jgi:hypothetical protein